MKYDSFPTWKHVVILMLSSVVMKEGGCFQNGISEITPDSIGFPGHSVVKEFVCNAGNPCSIPRS